jgi:hypothetical protein
MYVSVNMVWNTVGFDYLTHLHGSNGVNSVLIVVDHLTRMAHFLPRTETVTADETATLLLQGVYRLLGLLRVLVSDRDPKFDNGFWHTLWRRLVTRLNMSSSRHPETDELTERVNNTFRQLLRCFSYYNGSDWTTLLPQAELRTTPLVHSELNTPRLRLILDSLMRSLHTYCYACDGQFQFRKTQHSGYD